MTDTVQLGSLLVLAKADVPIDVCRERQDRYGNAKMNAVWMRWAAPLVRSTFSLVPYRYSTPTVTRSAGLQIRLAAR